MAKKRAARVLHIEDNPLDQQLVADMLSAQETARYVLDAATTLDRGRELLGAGKYDLVLLDLNLPDSQSVATVEEIVSVDSAVPVIVISGIDNESSAMEALQKGAQDYLLKGHFDVAVLARSIRYAVHHKHLEESLRRVQDTLKWEVEERTKELIEANRELKRTAQLYRSLFDDSIEALFTLDEEGRFAEVNDVFVSLTGYSRDEAVGRSFRDGVSEQDAQRLQTAYREMHRSGGHIRDLEFTLIRKDGTRRIVEGSANLLRRDGAFAGFQGALRDVTERKKAEEALRESEVKYRQVVENAQEAIIVFVDDAIVYANPMSERITGYSVAELKGKTIRDISPIEDSEPAARELSRKLKRDSETYPSEYRYVKKTGEIGWYEAIAVAITWEKRPGQMVFAREVTERKKLEEQFLQAQKMDAIGAMAGGIAHNFNNILVGVMGYSEFLLADKTPDHPEYKALKTIFEGTQKASQLTRELLNVTRAGEYRLVTGSLNEIVEHILPLMTGAFDKSIEIKTVLADNLPTFEVDAAYMQQCLLNLCLNARDAMPSGGTLLIETYQKYLGGDFVRTHIGSRSGEHLVLSVSDTGCGMTQEVKDHLFEPFFTTKREHGGTGMGLSTVYGTVKKHGGVISVYSEPGHGTTFNLYFPVTGGAVREEHFEDVQDHGGGHETILIIDDEPVVRNVWMEYLLRKGYEVLLAENGEQGLALFKEHRDSIGLVILDVIMPKMGGKETLAALREANPGVRVLITSGYALNGKAGEIDMRGTEGFVQKPATLKEFSEKIRKILDRSGRK